MRVQRCGEIIGGLGCARAILLGFEAIIVKVAGDRVDPLTGIGVGCIVAGLVFFLYLAGTWRLSGNVLNQSGFLYGLAGIVSFAIGHFLYYTAINKSGAGLSANLVATYPIARAQSCLFRD